MDFREATQGYLLFKAARASPNTIETDRVLFRQFTRWYGDGEVADIDADTIRECMDYHKERGLSAYTICRHHAVLSALFEWLRTPDVGLADNNPARAVKPPKLPKLKPQALPKEAIEAMLRASEQMMCKRRARALLLFLLDTGARSSEAAGVRMQDVDWNSGRVKRAGKGGKERFVYLGKRALSAPWLYVRDERPDPAQIRDDHVFLTSDGYPINRFTVGRIVKRVAQAAGVSAHAHQFRHSSTIEHLCDGMDLVSVQHMLGHESLEVTQGYLTALDDEDVEERARRTSPVDNWRL